MTASAPAVLEGIGLITGQPCRLSVSLASAGSGILFTVNGTDIPATPASVVDANRGVTLAANGQTLSIVEHFLSACAMTGHADLHVTIDGAPECPLLDGSAAPWVAFLNESLPPAPPSAPFGLTEAIYYQDPQRPAVQIAALPSAQLEITYLVNFDHPDLQNRWVSWSSDCGPLVDWIAPARTFGFVAELPAMQAQGLALGVTVENTVGLNEDGTYTSVLRFPDEPVRHKVLDFIGDMKLCGLDIPALKARIFIQNAGHAAHLAFGQQLVTRCKPLS